ncbi:MAG: histidine kinase [SAR324 cluster bacterium]|nr:histidine kinase [SAR324 cluster bacterium]
MATKPGLLVLSILYFGLLFGIAYYADKRRELGKSLINNPTIYALSLGVYCTAWTFYGSVGRAANLGLTFLPIYLGPTLMVLLWGTVVRKIIHICKLYSITSAADFISSRYGKSPGLGGLVAIIAVVGILPYISLQLKAISFTFEIVRPVEELFTYSTTITHFTQDATFYITIILILFAILFGVRRLDVSERHEGLVAVIAFESIAKLVAFISVGLFVVYGMYDGFGDLFGQASKIQKLQSLWSLEKEGVYSEWLFLLLLSMLSILFLPRQFQVAVIENVNETHLNRAIWLFPLYMLLINIFVLPIALAGRLHFPNMMVDADTFVLTLPLAAGQKPIAWLVFIGGLSAATSMIVVSSVALSNMICNSLVMPILIRLPIVRIYEEATLNTTLLRVRRGSVAVVLLISYIYFRLVSDHASLVSTGLVSFLAVAQFAPSLLGGLYWKNGTKAGAWTGLLVGFGIWGYTQLFSQLIQAGFFPQSILTEGLFGIHLLRPMQLFGLDSMSPISQATFWSLLLNTICYIAVSLMTRQDAIERSQANLFVDATRYSDTQRTGLWRGTANTEELRGLLQRFLGEEHTKHALNVYAGQNNLNLSSGLPADSSLVQYTEKLLSGAIGSVSARIMVASVVKEEPLKMEEVMDILDATQQAISYSQELEEKSEQLQKLTRELQEMDALKDEFISVIAHELRTPLTSIRAFSEILYDNLEIKVSKREQFLSLIIKESERLTRFINQVLDFEKLQSGKIQWHMEELQIKDVIEDSISSISQLARDKLIQLHFDPTNIDAAVYGDYDQLMQVMINLLSNAVKFCPKQSGEIWVQVRKMQDHVEVRVKDNGLGISPEEEELVFEKFRQVQKATQDGNPTGTGLGLPICKRIIEHHQGQIGIAPGSENGAIFYFTLLPAEHRHKNNVIMKLQANH